MNTPDLGALPLTALAPMQDVTGLDFMRLIAARGAPGLFVTEYFRVHKHSVPEANILASITQNQTGRPIFAQLIGENLHHMARTVEALLPHPIAGIDLNMGCPAPKVYKKHAGGGLLRDLPHVDRLLRTLRAATPGLFTVKTRIGFEDTNRFDDLLELLARHRVDMLSLHARTVKEMYRGEPHYPFIRRAVETLPCPVLANGNLTSAPKALRILRETGAAGVMIGRAAIRNPWIFAQVHAAWAREDPAFAAKLHADGLAANYPRPTLADVRAYVDDLLDATRQPEMPEERHVARAKKFLNFLGEGIDADGRFLHEMRRCKTYPQLLGCCDRHMLNGGRGDELFSEEPISREPTRPNREGEPVVACSL